ncbi:MAG: selenide, water dikinase SelD, partial [Planctomycetes bacterium]|nr:selenide, water dikinase SelD [Planctomycetota bacterium]
MNPSPPIEKHVVLAGAGNAHLVALRSLAMNPQPRIAVTLVNAYPESPYSAMVPGHIGGDYTADEVSIDLAKVCHAAGARLVVGEVEGIDPVNRQVKVSGRPYLRYDALSVSLGSRPWMPPGETAGAMRPLGELVSRIERADALLRDRPGPVRWVVVGGGASGCEIALAIRKRLGVHPGFELSLVHANDRLVPGFPAKASGRLREAFEGRGVALHLGRRVTGLAGKSLQLDDGSRIPFDEVIWATSASAPDLYSESGLTTDGDGFIVVDDFLRSVSHPEVFATGDGASHRSHPALPKNGVHAVRQGKVLWANLLATLMERPLHRWNPQWATLSLLNTADGDALATWGPLTAKGSFWRRMKDRIDRRWMGMFSGLSAMPSQATDAAEPLMRCGGCGSKVSSDVLGEVLSSLDTGEDPRLLVGARDGEDASVHLMDPTLYGAAGRVVEVQTVDHFKSFIDDPYLFGRVAALHSVSDIFAMNARPFCALAIATVPHARGPVQRDLLREMLGGATRELRALRVALSGGHTTEGTELALGLAVTGHGERDTLFRKGGLRPGDKLVITKPVGTGA